MFLLQIGGQFHISLLFGLVLLEQLALHALKQFVDLNSAGGTLLAVTSLVL
jgi:hypothetical protein